MRKENTVDKYNYGDELPTRGPILWAFEQIKKDSIVLEMGAANGLLTRHLAEDKNCTVDIVEIDTHSGVQAKKYARTALLGADEGNLDQNEWLTKLYDRKYDYILFIDVLEHLREPQEALIAAKKLLEKNGSILLSIPNIGHNAVLINLYNNIFRYQELGILDNTHLRFFTQGTVDELLSSCGLVAVKREAHLETMEDCLIRSAYSQVPFEIANAMRYRENGLVAQYLIEAKEDGNADPCLTIFEQTEQCCIYDGEKGVLTSTELLAEKQLNPYGLNTIKIPLLRRPEENSITIQPLNHPCVLSEIEVFAQLGENVQPIEIIGSNGILHQNALLFSSQPRVYVQLPTDFTPDTILLRLKTAFLQDKTLVWLVKNAEKLPKLELELQDKAAHIEQLIVSERTLKGETERQFAKIIEKNTQIAELEENLRIKTAGVEQLNRIKSSRSWRFLGYVWKVRDVLIPKGSKRRLAGKMLVKFVKHPIRFISKCSPKRIGKLFKTLQKEGTEGVSHRLDDCLIGTALPEQRLSVQAMDLASGKSVRVKTTADYVPLSVPQWDGPKVSIVIPVYDQFDYTYLCIKSILENSGGISYEIILADDQSADLTRQIDDVIHGLRTIHNTENLRFLRNCNNAAKVAKGQYILFLNNDTQVQENWLEPLVSLIERDEKVGMVGSKLVYPDGRLQEAGGIFWRDGSAWNYGNRADPALPEYNYVKEVDYISGAAIMLRRTLWETIGGFDDRFAPAYCEDSDLAFEVRRRGYKVLYQPLSVVVHFEGVSNGTDTANGQKAYQVTNQKKFYEKWKDVLEEENFPNGQNVFLARDRSRNKKTLLMVDHYVPMYDKDAGSRAVFSYLQLFIEKGYNIKFIGDNFFPHQPYTQTLQQMGIEVLYGSYYEKYWKQWLEENGAFIGYAFLNRPHITVKYIDELRNRTSAKIAYFGHDLHFLREKREYEITNDPALLRSSEEWKKKELALMRKADVSYYPSCVEEQIIGEIDSSIKVRAIPLYQYKNITEIPYGFDSRNDLMFIGGYNHHPNVDAAKWFAKDIMPRLLELVPDIKIHMMGSNAPKEVMNLADDHLLFEGAVSDEQLACFYKECRISIVPLRYGAGIKGKVLEAMSQGVPVMTTPIGAEGIAGAEDILCIAEESITFAEKLAALYQDRNELERRSRESYQYIREHFSPENVVRVIGPDFDM